MACIPKYVFTCGHIGTTALFDSSSGRRYGTSVLSKAYARCALEEDRMSGNLTRTRHFVVLILLFLKMIADKSTA